MDKHSSTADISRRRTQSSAEVISISDTSYVMVGGSSHLRTRQGYPSSSTYGQHYDAQDTSNYLAHSPEANTDIMRSPQSQNPMERFFHDRDPLVNNIAGGLRAPLAGDGWSHSHTDEASINIPVGHVNTGLSDNTHQFRVHDAAASGSYYQQDNVNYTYTEGHKYHEDIIGVGSQFNQQTGESVPYSHADLVSYNSTDDTAVNDAAASDTYYQASDFAGVGYQFEEPTYPYNYTG